MSESSALLYSKDHEWVRFEGETAVIGITDYAQHALGDIVYVELPRVGQRFAQFASIGVVESVKSVSELYTPVVGEVIEVNTALESDAGVINRSPQEEGWIIKLRLEGDGGRDQLLDAEAYQRITSDT